MRLGIWSLAAIGGLIAAAPLPASPARVWALSSLETVRPRATPTGSARVVLEAARGESESFQIVVRASGRAIAALAVDAGPLVGPGGTHLVPVVSRVAFVTLRTPSSSEGGVGPWPDPLVPTVDGFVGERRNGFPVPVAAGMDAAAWIDVWVPRGAPAGDYRGEVVARDGGEIVGRVPVALRVHRFTLPATSSIAVSFGFAASSAGMAHFGRSPTEAEARELARRYGVAALRHRISLHGGTMEPPSVVADGAGGAHLDFRAWDDEIGPFLDGTVERGGPAEGARWTAFDVRWPKADNEEARTHLLAEVQSHLAARGWLDRAFDYVADEPPPARLGEVRARAEADHRAAPSIARLVTRGPNPLLDGAIEIWCPVVNLADPKASPTPLDEVARAEQALDGARREAGIDGAARAARRQGARLWWYQSCLSHGCDGVGEGYFTGWPSLVIDAPPVAHRIFEWLSLRAGVAGELYYNTVEAFADGDPWRDPLRHGGNGDGTLFYPGRPDVIGGATHIPVASIRLARIRDGLEDYEYLALYARLAGREAADRIARTVAERAFRWSHDPARLLAARAELARRLDALTPQ